MPLKTTKGSKWLKCDLHIHTPASFFHGYGNPKDDGTWKKFIAELEALPPEFKIIGINDYLTLDGYRKVLEYKRQGKLEKIECILPVIEFRINRFAGESKLRRINYHVIFSDDIDVETIQSQFLNSLASKYTLESGSSDPDWSAGLTHESLVELGQRLKEKAPANDTLQNESDWQVGFNNFNVDYDELQKILSRHQFRDRVITAIGKGEWDDFRWDAGGAADKRTIINESNIVFLSSETPEHYETARAKLHNDQVNDKLLDCSDAHYYSDSEEKDRIGNCNTWLKIEPTFNGLKQVLFVPEDRIYVGETHPDTKAPYQVISHVSFINGGDYFTDATIEMSSGLNSIIGGKSTGKSVLAGLIVKASDPYEYNRRKGKEKLNELNWISEKQTGVDFHVHWKDGGITRLSEEENKRKITYFPQHYLNSQINDTGAGNKELNKIIRNVLSQTKTYNEAFQSYEEKVQSIDQDIAADASAFDAKLRELRSLKHALKEKGKSADIQKNIDRLNKELAALKSQYGLSEEELRTHQDIAAKVKVLEDQKQTLAENADILSEIDKEKLKQALAPSDILGPRYEDLSDSVKQHIQTKLTTFTAGYIDSVYLLISETLKNQKEQMAEVETQIQQQKTAHEPILVKIRNSAPLREKSDLIKQENIKLDEVKNIEERIKSLNAELDNISERLVDYLNQKIQSTEIVKTNITQHPFADGDDQLGIEIDHKCKAEHIQGILKERVKYQSNPAIKAFINDYEFQESDIERYSERLKTLLSQARNESLELKGEHKISGIIQEILSNAVYLNYDLKLGDDSFSIMSPGKRALALLRVLVELDQSQHPIILDQPEDDLDNRSVYEGLAKYLKRKKRDRQIIVVTHNPNVVVGADSEYVIVANQSGQESNQDNRNFRFEYVYGGLEDSFEEEGNPYTLERQGIREHVCEILDGGEDAFEKREKLYTGFKKAIRKTREGNIAIAAE